MIRGRKRQLIVAILTVVWIAVSLVHVILKPPPWVDAILWIAIFAIATAVSGLAVADARRAMNRIKSRPVVSRRPLVNMQLLKEMKAEGWVRREVGRFFVSIMFLLVGIIVVLSLEIPSVPVFFGAGLGFVGNILLDKVDRDEQIDVYVGTDE